MRVLVCGDRNWNHQSAIDAVLTGLLSQNDELVIIEGDARGADRMAGEWAEFVRGNTCDPVRHETYPADWSEHGRAAGPIRNRQMLAAKPDLVVAFHNDLSESKGTKDMVTIARKARIPVWVVAADESSTTKEAT